MDLLEIPEADDPQNGYEASNKKGKYDRFTTFVKEFVDKAINGLNTGVPFFEKLNGFPTFYKGSTDGDWWEQAKKLGNGKKLEKSTIPELVDPEKGEIKAVMDTFFPLYRAVKESYERRPFWQWITNHAQYTAERDTAKALLGVLMSLTGKTESEIDDGLFTYCNRVDEVFTPKERSRMLNALRDGAIVDFYAEPSNDGLQAEEAMEIDPEAYFVDQSMIDFEQGMQPTDYFSDEKQEIENEDEELEFKPEDVVKANKWQKTGNEELVALFDEEEKIEDHTIVLDADDEDIKREQVSVDEKLVSLDNGGAVLFIDEEPLDTSASRFNSM